MLRDWLTVSTSWFSECEPCEPCEWCRVALPLAGWLVHARTGLGSSALSPVDEDDVCSVVSFEGGRPCM